MKLLDFIRESNRIEGIERDVKAHEVDAHQRFLACEFLTVKSVEDFVFDICGMRLRTESGMNVRVGPHLPPPGGSHIATELRSLLLAINGRDLDPYHAHIRYETLHPFMDGNGRSGRAIWVWHMQREGRDPFALPFLHRWYYESLDAATERTGVSA